jgi:hypothetical protein
MSTAQIITGKRTEKKIGTRAFIVEAFKKVALIPHLRDRWLTCETWASAINVLTRDGIDVDVNTGTVGSSLSRDNVLSTYADRYQPGENDTGYFKVVWDHTQFYYVCNPGSRIERPRLTTRWYAEVMKNQQIVPEDVDADGSITVPNRDRSKRRKTRSARSQDETPLDIEELRKQTYFDSADAEKLFKPTEDETVLDAIDRRIELWKGVHERTDGWQNMVAGDSDYNKYTEYNICRLKQQAVMLLEACTLAKEEMIDGKSTWDQCCKKAVKIANRFGMMACGSSKTLRQWHHAFVQSPEGFTHANAAIANGIGYLPPIL